MSLTDGFNAPSKRKLRGTLFLILGISAGTPVIHLLILGNSQGMVKDGNFNFYLLGAVCYIGGALLYMWRFPEKYWPGKFCLFVIFTNF